MQILHWYSMHGCNEYCWRYTVLRLILLTIPVSDKESIDTCTVKYNKDHVQSGNSGTGFRITRERSCVMPKPI